MLFFSRSPAAGSFGAGSRSCFFCHSHGGGRLGRNNPSTSEAEAFFGMPFPSPNPSLSPARFFFFYGNLFCLHGLGASLQCVAAGSFNFRGQRIRPRQATCCGADSSIRPFAKQTVRKRMSRHSCGIRFTCAPRPRIVGEENGFLWGGRECAEICSPRPTSTNFVQQILSPRSTRRWRERKFLPRVQRDAGAGGNSFPAFNETLARAEIVSRQSTRHWRGWKFFPVSRQDTGASGNSFPSVDKTLERAEILSCASVCAENTPATNRRLAAAKIHKT